jgi:hypothetical protein
MAGYKQVDPSIPGRLMDELERNGQHRRWAERTRVETEIWLAKTGLIAMIGTMVILLGLSGYMAAIGQSALAIAPLATAILGGAGTLFYRWKARDRPDATPHQADQEDPPDEHIEIGASAERRARQTKTEAKGRSP